MAASEAGNGAPPIVLAVPAGAGRRLDLFLHERFPEHSRSRLQGWIKTGRVLVNGVVVKAAHELHGGETIEVRPAAPPALRAVAEDLPLEILYEAPDVIAVNKPAGMVVHVGAGRDSGTLVNALLHRFRRLSQVHGDERPGIVHRIDKDTSGVLLVARTDAAHRALAGQFSSREVGKTYVALAEGRVRAEQGRIDKPITRDPKHRTRMTARLAAGRQAVTEYRVLQRWNRFTLLEVRILTGRTHQIRAHLSSIGHPVAGDRLYGAAAGPTGRFFLHAQRIRFRSPSTGEPVTVEAPLPPELQQWLQSL
jgi:23S rRNA pseudouridine1911/1915/1917 synthase